ncbi:hypothetical protein BRM1_07635 [Brevibacterium sp. BRM-1]|uniref:hypothetical protein n=1 Tax=Brevibacterium sp. BRM-1 TaxID=2999062 RepID=UPI00227EBB82|nr:hypothetical protein [Brevibacterium sp. BRM-1]WAL39171.1 hypothetical protein BRM1_07635 [Brevibacterium sp. BRM-1]
MSTPDPGRNPHPQGGHSGPQAEQGGPFGPHGGAGQEPFAAEPYGQGSQGQQAYGQPASGQPAHGEAQGQQAYGHEARGQQAYGQGPAGQQPYGQGPDGRDAPRGESSPWGAAAAQDGFGGQSGFEGGATAGQPSYGRHGQPSADGAQDARGEHRADFGQHDFGHQDEAPRPGGFAQGPQPGGFAQGPQAGGFAQGAQPGGFAQGDGFAPAQSFGGGTDRGIGDQPGSSGRLAGQNSPSEQFQQPGQHDQHGPDAQFGGFGQAEQVGQAGQFDSAAQVGGAQSSQQAWEHGGPAPHRDGGAGGPEAPRADAAPMGSAPGQFGSAAQFGAGSGHSGSAPSAVGSAPAAYGSAPAGYGSAPAGYGSAPSSSGSAPTGVPAAQPGAGSAGPGFDGPGPHAGPQARSQALGHPAPGKGRRGILGPLTVRDLLLILAGVFAIVAMATPVQRISVPTLTLGDPEATASVSLWVWHYGALYMLWLVLGMLPVLAAAVLTVLNKTVASFPQRIGSFGPDQLISALAVVAAVANVVIFATTAPQFHVGGYFALVGALLAAFAGVFTMIPFLGAEFADRASVPAHPKAAPVARTGTAAGQGSRGAVGHAGSGPSGPQQGGPAFGAAQPGFGQSEAHAASPAAQTASPTAGAEPGYGADRSHDAGFAQSAPAASQGAEHHRDQHLGHGAPQGPDHRSGEARGFQTGEAPGFQPEQQNTGPGSTGSHAYGAAASGDDANGAASWQDGTHREAGRSESGERHEARGDSPFASGSGQLGPDAQDDGSRTDSQHDAPEPFAQPERAGEGSAGHGLGDPASAQADAAGEPLPRTEWAVGGAAAGAGVAGAAVGSAFAGPAEDPDATQIAPAIQDGSDDPEATQAAPAAAEDSDRPTGERPQDDGQDDTQALSDSVFGFREDEVDEQQVSSEEQTYLGRHSAQSPRFAQNEPTQSFPAAGGAFGSASQQADGGAAGWAGQSDSAPSPAQDGGGAQQPGQQSAAGGAQATGENPMRGRHAAADRETADPHEPTQLFPAFGSQDSQAAEQGSRPEEQDSRPGAQDRSAPQAQNGPAEEPQAPRLDASQAFWFAVPESRQAVDPQTGQPVFTVTTGEWFLALADHGNAFTVRDAGGQEAVLFNIEGIQRG